MRFCSPQKATEFVVGAWLVGQSMGHPGRLDAAQDDPCPFLEQQHDAGLGWAVQAPIRSLSERTGDGGVPSGGFAAVKADLKALLTNSQAFWPADFSTTVGANYGGLFIRLAWHCSGSYRESDGRGGCDGGRIRFNPELSWPDNANLDKARKLLEPIKKKYGSSLSWGDLIVLSGTTAIEANGGTILGFCGGRIDDADGSNSLKLGPSPEQEEIGPCLNLTPSLQGNCLSVNGTVLGPTTVGLIYVNPAGPVNFTGNPLASGADVRKAFARMGFNDTESVALIGGGHAFGKAHGACPSPPCGNGIGNNTFTSGFEGQWTDQPTTWSNDYFNNLFDFTWTNITGPGGKLQWTPSTNNGTKAPDIFMLTTDIALSRDILYKPISHRYAGNLDALTTDFAAAWYRLTSSDMGPSTRCIGEFVALPQPFQNTLPAGPATLPDYVPIRTAIQALLDNNEENAVAFINLAYKCASTFRATDYRGGCNGARIRFKPESSWPTNAGISISLTMLHSIKDKYQNVSYADLIVLAGLTSLESMNKNHNLTFCGGAVDASDANGSDILAPRVYSSPNITVSDDFQVKGLSPDEGVALASRLNVSSQYYVDLIAAGGGNGGNFTDEELALLEGDFRAIVDSFAANETLLFKTFDRAWTYLLTADRYSNNRENACTGVATVTTAAEASSTSAGATFAPSLLYILCAAGIALFL